MTEPVPDYPRALRVRVTVEFVVASTAYNSIAMAETTIKEDLGDQAVDYEIVNAKLMGET